jgi:hypothetical protein
VHAFRAVTLKCRSWGCPLCYEDRKKQVIAQAQSGKPTSFITLTTNPATGFSPEGRARALAEAWPIVVKLACKKYGYDCIPYFCVFEATKKGEPHLHILARVKWIDQAWLSNTMRDLIGAPNVWIERVKGAKHVAKYVAKYIGKDPQRFGTCKRYWKTRSYALTLPPTEPEASIWCSLWYVLDRSLAELRRTWAAKGWDTAMEGRMLVAMDPGPPVADRGAS